jgi:histone H2B
MSTEQSGQQEAASAADDGELATQMHSVRVTGKRPADFSASIYQVLKQIHPDLGISRKSMSIVNSFLFDVLRRLADQAAQAARETLESDPTRTPDDLPLIDAKAVQIAVRRLIPGQLAKHAVSEGTKAIVKYSAASQSDPVDTESDDESSESGGDVPAFDDDDDDDADE